MTFEDLYRKILAVLPKATLEEDSDGQIVIQTGMMETNGYIIEMAEDEDDDD